MITVDTHIIIWDALRPEMLTAKAKKAIDVANRSDGIIFCEISLWEIAMLLKKKRIEVQTSYLEFINMVRASNKYIFQGITPEIAELTTQLPDEINLDPADRIIASTAIITNTSLVTADENLRSSKKVRTIW
ncbi:MAG: type II toxin-antitoxin system VapC family toxin [Candidatus Latescibacteria bacterium]|nr:type II toxin-antitoxin system VapC family toxin [Candidatus Latescibacterota bacterium]